MTKRIFGMAAGLGTLLSASIAAAQPTDPPAGGSTSVESTTSVSTTTPVKPAATTATVTTTTETSTAKKDDGLTDHERVIGKLGVMYFGVNQQPIANGPATGVGPIVRNNVSTPVIGVRYWLKERLGIDAGLGFSLTSGSATTQPPNGPETTVDGASIFAFAIHGGLPLAFAYGKHYKFLLVPELNFGYATRTDAVVQNAAPNAIIPPDIHRSGVRFEAGARVGTEIQFGFIGVPELALQASVGLGFRNESWSASQDAGRNAAGVQVGASSASEHATSFGTSVQSDPWAIFTNNISAIYYLP